MDEFPCVAIRSGLSEGEVTAGILKLWRFCWKNKTAYVDPGRVGTFFPGDQERVVQALELCGFVRMERDKGLYIRGAEKRLGLLKARSEGGKKSRGNLKQYSGSPPAQAGDQPEVQPDLQPAVSSGSAPGLTSSIQHPASFLSEKKAEPPARPHRDKKPSTQMLFHAWVVEHRQGLKLPQEKKRPEKRINSMLQPVVAEVGLDGAKAKYRTFLGKVYWRDKDPPWPLEAFASQWRKLSAQKPSDELFESVTEETYATG